MPARRVVVIGPPPTPNGDLHVGHIAGPYLAADVHARYLRTAGRPVIYTSGTDDSQTYVVASAAKLGTTPEALAEKSWHDIRATFELMGIALDGFAPFDDGYRAGVLDFVTRLHAAGKLRPRTVRLPYSVCTGQFLMEGLVCGGCPTCLGEPWRAVRDLRASQQLRRADRPAVHCRQFRRDHHPRSADHGAATGGLPRAAHRIPPGQAVHLASAHRAAHGRAVGKAAAGLPDHLSDRLGHPGAVPADAGPGDQCVGRGHAGLDVLHRVRAARAGRATGVLRRAVACRAGRPASLFPRFRQRLLLGHDPPRVAARARRPLRPARPHRLQRVLRAGEREVLDQQRTRDLDEEPSRRGAARSGPVLPGADRSRARAHQLQPGRP